MYVVPRTADTGARRQDTYAVESAAMVGEVTVWPGTVDVARTRNRPLA
jgi:hypothetical protein